MKKQVLFIDFYPLHSMKIIRKDLTEVIHCQRQYRRKSPEQLNYFPIMSSSMDIYTCFSVSKLKSNAGGQPLLHWN